ncbi:energy transducer TonB [Fluviicola chungangensis]|uniref:TonB family protein n=1 Tax=Fluviicola chungangensis TaxID=2597671 RepID=A0A556MNT3_9FLAO|nr:energy transducer TonB [Fluviicola chungangensis]TSJ41621.1 TonB family protein [Fluviicola chungangensis]
MKYLLIALSILATVCVFAQQKRDTIYYDLNWVITKQAEGAVYYRIITKTDDLYCVRDYYLKSDSVQMTGAFKDESQKIKEGEFSYYYENGVMSSKEYYKNGKLNGKRTKYDASGRLYSSGDFTDGIFHGDFIIYYENGGIKKKETYEHGNLTGKEYYLEDGKITTYLPDETPAYYPDGGNEGIKKYIKENLKYPKYAVDKKIEGKVYLKFVVSLTGEITNVKVQKGVHPILDEEAVRVIEAMPKWVPGKVDGQAVNSIFSMPITFSLKK